MKLLRLHATFGRLRNAELTLQDGLNVFELPNEAGKSTWGAFLLAMFYGIDTAERSSKGSLPAKKRYQPWNGAAMEGVVELEWQGRAITIQRTSTPRAPLSVFRAYETSTGEPVPELTAENCGRTLLGVERSVFERSAFIRQTALSVSQDNALEARLHALVTTGDEGAGLTAAERTLQEQWNHLARPRTGLLPQLEAELEALRRQQQELTALATEVFSLTAQQTALTQERADAAQALTAARAAQAAKQLNQLRQAAEAAQQAQEAAELAAAEAAGLPSAAELAALERAVYAVPPAPAGQPTPPVPPVIPEVFRGLDETEIASCLEADLRDFDAADAVPKVSPIPLIVSALLAVAGLALLFRWLPVGLALILCGFGLSLYAMRKRRQTAEEENRRLARRTEIQVRYGTTQRAEMQAMAQRCRQALALYRQEQAAYEAAAAAHTAAQLAHENAKAAALARIRAIAPAADLTDALSVLSAARKKLEAAQEAQNRAAQAAEYAEKLRTVYGDPDPALAAAAQPNAPDLHTAETQLRLCSDRLNALNSRLERCRGQLSALGDPGETAVRLEQLEERRAALQLHADALRTAQEALKAAGAEVQTRISPALNERAGSFLRTLTGGRYDRVLLERSFAASARLSGEAVQRELGYLSAGTADQLYLALRLAICTLALPEDTPLVLDDALLTFDEERCRTALKLLQEQAQTRQILLFTCQSRENRILNGAVD